MDIDPENLQTVEAGRVFYMSPIPPFKEQKSLKIKVLGFHGVPGASFLRIFLYKMTMEA